MSSQTAFCKLTRIGYTTMSNGREVRPYAPSGGAERMMMMMMMGEK